MRKSHDYHPPCPSIITPNVTGRVTVVTAFVTGWTLVPPNVHAVCNDVTGPRPLEGGGRTSSASPTLILTLTVTLNPNPTLPAETVCPGKSRLVPL